MWDEITYSFPNFNGATVEVWEWISDFIPHFTRLVSQSEIATYVFLVFSSLQNIYKVHVEELSRWMTCDSITVGYQHEKNHARSLKTLTQGWSVICPQGWSINMPRVTAVWWFVLIEFTVIVFRGLLLGKGRIVCLLMNIVYIYNVDIP